MAKDAHMATTKELIQLGKSLGFRVYSSDDVGEPTIQLPKTIDLSVLSSADQIDIIWFTEYNFPKYAPGGSPEHDQGELHILAKCSTIPGEGFLEHVLKM